MVQFGRETFSSKTQALFAELSGDINPIHIDSEIARRSIAGHQVVYGMHVLLASLDLFCKYEDKSIINFDARFLDSIKLNVPVFINYDYRNDEIFIIQESRLCSKISLITMNSTVNFEKRTSNNVISKDSLLSELEIDSYKSQIRNYDFSGNAEVGETLFPNLFKKHGDSLIVEIASLSEIIGMKIPGKNSLLIRVTCNIRNLEIINKTYKLIRYEPRLQRYEIEYSGAAISAKVEAIRYRNPPNEFYNLDNIGKSITKNEFSHVNALIIGGSRGLGEITSKIIALGGGKVLITYNKGEKDAERICSEMRTYNLDCKSMFLDITGEYTFAASDFNQIYYFASPRIMPEKTEQIRAKQKLDYELYFNAGFMNLINQINKLEFAGVVFYPSTSYIDSPQKWFEGYALSKLKGEKICRDFNEKGSDVLKCLTARLPRLPTDQTMGLIEEKFESPILVLVDIVRAISARIMK